MKKGELGEIIFLKYIMYNILGIYVMTFSKKGKNTLNHLANNDLHHYCTTSFKKA